VSSTFLFIIDMSDNQ